MKAYERTEKLRYLTIIYEDGDGLHKAVEEANYRVTQKDAKAIAKKKYGDGVRAVEISVDTHNGAKTYLNPEVWAKYCRATEEEAMAVEF